MSSSKKVLILYRYLPQYRIKFYNLLKEKLEAHNVELSLIYSAATKKDAKRIDQVDIPWAKVIRNRVLTIGSEEIIWQPVVREIRGKDLVIIEQASKLLINYYLMLHRKLSKTRVAYWGHGITRDVAIDSWQNKLKIALISWTDWWFAYTSGVKSYIASEGYDADKITAVENAIDTKHLRAQYLKIKEADVLKLKRQLNIKGSNIGVYCGAIYADKKISFLMEAALKVKEKIDDFELIIIGKGHQSDIVESFAQKYDWIHYVGPQFGSDRIIYFKMASLLLLPAAVGLAILDAFAMETPLITTNIKDSHGPEIDYLENECNGLITDFDLAVYSDKIIETFSNKQTLAKLVEGCRMSSTKYNLEQMVDNFSTGILKCLNID